MIIWELIDGSEYVSNEEGEFISCPVCKKNWVKNIGGDVTHGECSHLRFSFSDDGGFDFFNNWVVKDIANRFYSIVETQVNEESFDAYDSVFRELLTGEDIDEIVYWIWDDMPLVTVVMFWGYVKE